MATTFIIATTILVAAVLAAWPLLWLRGMRRATHGALGSLCVLAGCGAFFAVCSGLVQSPVDAKATAADSGSNESPKTLPGAEAAEPAPVTVKRQSIDDKALITYPRPDAGESKLPEGAELHTPPKVPSEVVIPPGRPEWVSKSVTVGSLHSIAVSSGPYSTQAEADRELDKLLKAKTDEYIAEHLGSTLAPQLIDVSRHGWDTSRIKRELVKPENYYREQITVSFGPMQQSHALLEFGPDFRRDIEQSWHDIKGGWRLTQIGLIAGGVLLFLGTVFSYFRLDTATRGYYTGRLQFMTAAAILAIVGAGAVLAQYVKWL